MVNKDSMSISNQIGYFSDSQSLQFFRLESYFQTITRNTGRKKFK